MDLEQMQSVWKDLSGQLEQQKQITDDIILKMRHGQSRSSLDRIIRLEAFGAIFSACAVVYLLKNSHRFDNWLNISALVGTIAILLFSIGIAIILIKKANKINLLESTYAQTMEDFSAFKKVLRFYKRMSIGIYFLIPLFVIPVTFVILFDKNLLDDLEEFQENLIASFLILPIGFWLIFKYYGSMVAKVRDAIGQRSDH